LLCGDAVRRVVKREDEMPAVRTPTTPPVMESLQVLRALAALIVVMIHVEGEAIHRFGKSPLPQFVGGGIIGVDVFFCLSGFIMYYTMHGKFGTQGTVLGFLQKRFLRIYPVYWVATVLTLLVGYWEPRVVDWRALNPIMVAKSLMLFPQGIAPVLRQGWTLVHELKFYVVFGLLLILPHRRSIPLFWVWAVGSAATLVLSVVSGRWLVEDGVGRIVNYLLHPVNLEFLSGILAAWVVLHKRTTAWLDAGLLAVGVVWAGIVTHYFWALKPDTKYHAVILFALPSFLLVLGATLVERRWRPEIPRWLVKLGDASYSTYLFHELLIPTAIWHVLPGGASPWGRTLFSLALVAVLHGIGMAAHLWLEVPILGLGRKVFPGLQGTRKPIG
jgi:exopolysaccharide production protein ExoZ